MQQHQPASGENVLSNDIRQKMLNNIYRSIKESVMAARQSEEYVKKYAYNIETTALKSCNGNLAEYERLVGEMVGKINQRTNSHQHQQQPQQQQQQVPAGMVPQMAQPQQPQGQQHQQQMMGMQQNPMSGVGQYSMAQYPAAAQMVPQMAMGQQYVPQPGMYNPSQMTQISRPAQLQQQVPQQVPQQQQQTVHMQMQQPQQAGMQMHHQQQAPNTMQAQHMQQQQQQQQQQPSAQAQRQTTAPAGGAPIMAQESADPAFYDFLQELANEPSVLPPAKQQPAAAAATLQAQQQMPMQQQHSGQMPGYRPSAQQTQAQMQQGLMQQQQQQPLQQQMGPASGGFTALMQQGSVPQQQQPVQQAQNNYGANQQLQGVAGAQKMVPNPQQTQMQQPMMMTQPGMQQPVMFVPQQQMPTGAFVMGGMPASSSSMMPQQQQQQPGAFPGYVPVQQQLQGQQQMPMQQQTGMMAAMQPQQLQQQIGQVGMAAQQQQQQQMRMQGGMVMSGPASNGPTSGSAGANKAAVAAAAAAAAQTMAPAQQRSMQPPQQQQQPQLVQLAGQAAVGGPAGAAAGSNTATAAATAAQQAYAQQAQQVKAATLAQVSAMSPRTRTVKYYQQLDDLRHKYAKDLHELHQLLQSQRVTPANKDKINGFMQRTNALLQALNMPRPVSADAAHHIPPESFLQLLSMRKQCETMVNQLLAIRTKKPGMYKTIAASQQSGAQQQPGLAQALRQQQAGAMGPPVAGYAATAATPDEVVSRPTAAPSPMGAGAAPSPAPGAAATAATPPIGIGVPAAAQMIKPDMPPAPLLPAAVGSADMSKAAAAAAAQAAAAGSTGQATGAAAQAVLGSKEASAATAATAAVEKQPSAGTRTLLSAAAAGVAADTPLGKLYAALATATEPQLVKAAEQQAVALEWSAHAARLGPLPSDADFAAAEAVAAGTPSEASDASATTVEVQLPHLHSTAIDSTTICERFPEGYQRPTGVHGVVDADADDPARAAADAESRKRRRQQVDSLCKTVESEFEGLVRLVVLPDDSASAPSVEAAGAVAVCIEYTKGSSGPPSAIKQESEQHPAAVSNDSSTDRVQPWKRLKLLVPGDYPREPPTVVFQDTAAAEASAGAAGTGEPTVKLGGDNTPKTPVALIRQQQLAIEAWNELQAALWEDPVTSLQGLAQHWCQAVEVVSLQQGT